MAELRVISHRLLHLIRGAERAGCSCVDFEMDGAFLMPQSGLLRCIQPSAARHNRVRTFIRYALLRCLSCCLPKTTPTDDSCLPSRLRNCHSGSSGPSQRPGQPTSRRPHPTTRPPRRRLGRPPRPAPPGRTRPPPVPDTKPHPSAGTSPTGMRPATAGAQACLVIIALAS